MDIFAHALWSVAGAKKLSSKQNKKINLKASVWWGIFPDLFAFALPFLQIFYLRATNVLANSDLGVPKDGSVLVQKATWFEYSPYLYNISHSIFVFSLVVLLVYLWQRYKLQKNNFVEIFPLALFAWLLHILIDIPTHSIEFYPTPVFWPISEYKFDGISWGEPWFMLINYGTMFCIFVSFLWKRNLLKKKPKI